METNRPTNIDMELVAKFIDLKSIDQKAKDVLKLLLLDSKYARIFKDRPSYILTCKAIIDMDMSSADLSTKQAFKDHYLKIYRCFLGYYQLLTSNKNETLRNRIYMDFCNLEQSKKDAEFLQTTDFLFNVYNRFGDLSEYNIVLKLISINNQYFDLLKKYCMDAKCSDIVIFLANNSSQFLSRQEYIDSLESSFTKEKKTNYYNA